MPGQQRYIDIFAGCGGASLGLHNAGWKGIFAIEKNPMAFETLKYNLVDKTGNFDWPEWLPVMNYNVINVLSKHSDRLAALNGKVDLVVGGPPCQGFSTAGRRDPSDQRNSMVNYYTKFIGLIRPRLIFFENVPGFQMDFPGKKKYSDLLIAKLGKLGYKTASKIVNFADYGVPQNRKRFLLVGTLDSDPETFFKDLYDNRSAFADNKDIKLNPSVSDAICDLERKNGEMTSTDSPNFTNGMYSEKMTNYQKIMRKKSHAAVPDSHRFANHSSRKVRLFKRIHKKYEGSTSCINIRNIGKTKKRNTLLLNPNLPSPTITTLPDDYIHYSEPRILTVRECARIQSFDDSFAFRGKYTTGGTARKLEVPRYTQVGNALAPLFVEQAGQILAKF